MALRAILFVVPRLHIQSPSLLIEVAFTDRARRSCSTSWSKANQACGSRRESKHGASEAPTRQMRCCLCLLFRPILTRLGVVWPGHPSAAFSRMLGCFVTLNGHVAVSHYLLRWVLRGLQCLLLTEHCGNCLGRAKRTARASHVACSMPSSSFLFFSNRSGTYAGIG